MSTSSTRDLGTRFGLSQRLASNIDTPDIIGSQLMWDITRFNTEFPQYSLMLDDLGWSNSDKLNRTYFTAAYNQFCLEEIGISGGWPSPPSRDNRTPIAIPSGKWFYNSELRSGQHPNVGDSPGYNYEQGGSLLQELETNWKSIHGAQNNGLKIGLHCWTYAGEQNLTPFPVAIGGGYEWCHHFTADNLAFQGNAGNFWDSSKRSVGVMYHVPGEESAVSRCRFSGFNDMGVLISNTPAPATIDRCHFFSNNVCGIGIRGSAYSDIMIIKPSGDYNPYMIAVFRGSSDWFGAGTGAYMPHASEGNPGGSITVISPKIESFACRNGYLGMSACNPPSSIGKGQMLAHLTGRFTLNVTGGNMVVHNGKVNSLMEVVDDFAAGFGGIPLDESEILLSTPTAIGYEHLLHDVYNNKKWKDAGSGAIDTAKKSFYWRHNYNTHTPVQPYTQEAFTSVAATYHGTQPYINENQVFGWDETAGPGAGENYRTVDGVNH